VPNKFPALMIEGDLNKRGEGIYDMMQGVGAHEVIIESPKHLVSTAELSDEQIREVLWVYRDRLVDLKKDRRLVYGLLFKNVGQTAGASLEHTHSQLIALPIVPKRVCEELDGSEEYYRFKERCVFCDMIRQEMQDGARIVAENQEFVLLAPYAPKFPFETWIIPKQHLSCFEMIREDQVPFLARILHLLMRKISAVLNDPPFNYIIHTAPLHQDLPHYHWHLEIMPKLTHVAGFEWGSGFYINPSTPEDAARDLRDCHTD